MNLIDAKLSEVLGCVDQDEIISYSDDTGSLLVGLSGVVGCLDAKNVKAYFGESYEIR